MKNLSGMLIAFSFATVSAQIPCVNGVINQQGSQNDFPCEDLILQAYVDVEDFNAIEAQDSWGWTDSTTNKEYAIIGLDNGTAFVDMTDPVNPIYLGRMNSHAGGSSYWRDVKVYNDYVFVVSEVSNDGLQIFDLKSLRGLSASQTGSNSRIFAEDAFLDYSDYDGDGPNGRAHNVVINEDTGYAYIVGVNRGSNSASGPIFVNIQDPENPIIEGQYGANDYFHDAQVLTYDGPDNDYTGQEIMIGANEDEIVIVDVSDKNNPIDIATVSYGNVRYTHQGWFTEDRRFFILGDEEDEAMAGIGNTRTLVFDFQDLDNPSLYYTYTGATPAIDHNGYVKGNRFYLANYTAGVRVIKIDGLYDELSPSMTEVSYMDTYNANDNASFNGTWNVYPFFESGNFFTTGFGSVSSNTDGGLFIMRDANYDNTPPTVICQNPTIYLDALTGTATIDETDLDNGSTDDFGIVKWSLEGQTTFTCADVGSSFNITLTAEDDYANKNSCTATVTIAAAPTTFNGSNWSDGMPGPGSEAIIAGTYNSGSQPQPNIDACSCTVNNGATLRIQAGDYLKTEGDIDVSGNLIVEHQGSVVQVDPAATVNKIGAGTVNVLVDTPNLASRDFMIMGSPMTAETRTGVWNSAWLVLEHHTENFVPNPDVANDFPLAENFADDNYDNWVPFTGNINPGEGYLVRPQASQGGAGGVFNFTHEQGTLNNGNINFSVLYNTPGPTSSANKNASPNVLANPYASAIWANDLINANSMIDEVYFWEHNTPPSPSLPGAGAMNFSMEDISMYNTSGGIAAASGGTTPNGYISTAQGFGIKANAAGTASFANAMRRTDNNNTLRDMPTLDRIWLKVSNEDWEMQASTLIAFSENATAGVDNGQDSRRLATVVSLYSHLEDGSQQLGIQTRESFESGIKVPLGFSSLIEDDLEYQISIENLEGSNLSESTVYLIDYLLDTITILNDNPYTFTSKEGTYHQRFAIVFEKNVVLGPEENELQGIVLFPNPTHNNLNIYSPYANLKALEVYDLLGKRLSENIEEERRGYSLNLSSLETGVYFVHISTESGSITKKVVKN